MLVERHKLIGCKVKVWLGVTGLPKSNTKLLRYEIIMNNIHCRTCFNSLRDKLGLDRCRLTVSNRMFLQPMNNASMQHILVSIVVVVVKYFWHTLVY